MGQAFLGGRMSTMSDAKPHLRTLDDIERTCVPGLVEVLRTEGVEGVRYALWDMTGWHRDLRPVRVAEPRHGGAETRGVGVVGAYGEDHRHGPARGAPAAGRGGDGRPRRGAGELLREQRRPLVERCGGSNGCALGQKIFII